MTLTFQTVIPNRAFCKLRHLKLTSFKLCSRTFRNPTLFYQGLFNRLLQQPDPLLHIGRIIASFQPFLREFVTNIQRRDENQLFRIGDSSSNFKILQPLIKVVRRLIQRFLLFRRAVHP